MPNFKFTPTTQEQIIETFWDSLKKSKEYRDRRVLGNGFSTKRKAGLIAVIERFVNQSLEESEIKTETLYTEAEVVNLCQLNGFSFIDCLKDPDFAHITIHTDADAETEPIGQFIKTDNNLFFYEKH